MSAARAVVLVPAATPIDPKCEDGLRQLERQGFVVWRVSGYSVLDVARSQMTTNALAEDFEELIWIDPNIVFHPEDVARLRGHGQPLVGGLYPKPGGRGLSCVFLPGTESITFGHGGGLVEVRYCGFGFVYSRCEVYEATRGRLRPPVCHPPLGRPFTPFFAPLAVPENDRVCYLSDEYAFCERARQCGYPVLADTTIRLWHVGRYLYGWEDAGRDKERFDTYHFHLSAPGGGQAALPAESELDDLRFDQPPLSASVNRRKYILCAAERTEASCLARLLRDAGIGVPHEYFHLAHISALSGRWGIRADDRDGYLQALVRYRTTPNGVWGVTLRWPQYRVWQAALDATVLGGAKLIHLERSAGEAGREPAHTETGGWERFLTERRDEPLRVRAEDLARNPTEIVERIARFLGLRPDEYRRPSAAEPSERPPAAEPATPLPRPFRDEAETLPPGFPRLRAYVVTYLANQESAQLTLDNIHQSDWGEEPLLFVQPADWPVGYDAAACNYKRALEHAADDGCDFALVLEDDIRVCRHLRHNLTTLPLVARDQCDFLSLYVPDLVANPWERVEPHLGYRLARPLYSGPNRLWEKHRLWGSQGYLLSRRFIHAALERWDRLKMGLDSRAISVCSELKLPMWYTAPCLVEHAPLRSAHSTPLAHAPDFEPEFRLEIKPGFQPPEAIPGWLTVEESQALWQAATGQTVLELGRAAGRATVCLGQSARRVVSAGRTEATAAIEWVRRYGLIERIDWRQGEVAEVCATLRERFGLVFIDTERDAASVTRDLDAALPLLEPGGRVAVHDYPDPDWPEVRRVVDDYARRLGWRRVAQAGYLGVFQT
jgi:LPS sulfotransferase NodH